MRSTDAPLAGKAIDLAGELEERARSLRGRWERGRAARTSRLLADPGGLGLVLALTDEVLRIRDRRRAAEVFAGLAEKGLGVRSLGPADRIALEAGARLAPAAPDVVIPAVRRRVLLEMSGVVLLAGNRRLAVHAARRRRQGIALNVNVLGEAILGEEEAGRRLDRLLDLLAQPAVDYLSVKVSSICSQLDVLCFEEEVQRVAGPLRRLYRAAAEHSPPKFVNLDMEEYRDLDLTLSVFRRVLDEPTFDATAAGIVLQAYLPDSLGALEELCEWARARHRRTGGWVKVRIVKGANLAMERVEAELHGWTPAPFATKAETDANYKRMVDVALHPANDGALRVGVASHNPFELAWAAVLAADRRVLSRVEFEMLEGMAPAAAHAVARHLGALRLYAPIVDRPELESAIAYLVRRLDENSSPENYLARQFSMSVGSPAWDEEIDRFRRSLADRHERPGRTRRTQDRTAEIAAAVAGRDGFDNEPDTDFTRAANRAWAADHLATWPGDAGAVYAPVVGGRRAERGDWQPGRDPNRPDGEAYRWLSASAEDVEQAIDTAWNAGPRWCATPIGQRQAVLEGAATALARRRGRLIATMAFDGAKTVREGDPEVSEAIDFAAYYARHVPGDGFTPYRVVTVASPWNFPCSIPAGGVLAALAAGSAVILKPAPETVAVAGELVEALWEAGVPRDVLQFVPCVDGDDSKRLITDPRVEAVVLTGAWDTALQFLRWRPSLDLHAETSGKNAVVVTATADLDEAIADVVRSAFGHAGQKCSAASLVIVEASVYDDGRFLRRLADAVRSIRTGTSWDLTTRMGPLIRPPEGPLRDALTRLEHGESWLVAPERLDGSGYLWTPAVKTGVIPGSAFHLTECFGPVLGVMRAADLPEAVRLQNQPAYGLTAGLQALDPAEIEHWRDHVEAGNLYVNKPTTGAIVQRQPFGGWKRSVVGPGAKAGGPNYVASLGRWDTAGETGPEPHWYEGACRDAWEEMRLPTDATGLASESNAFRYRPVRSALLCRGAGVGDGDVARARGAAAAVGASVEVVDEPDFEGRLVAGQVAAGALDKVRLLGKVSDTTRLGAIEAGLWVDSADVAASAAHEVLRWVREQAVSESRHRHGNVSDRRPGLGVRRRAPVR